MAADSVSPRSAVLRARRLRWFEVGAALLLLSACYFHALDRVPFHGDEVYWIQSSEYFERFFGGEEWTPNYWTVSQPSMTRYVIGLGRWIGGYRVPDLAGPEWDWSQSTRQNLLAGRRTPADLLWWSRLAVAVCAVGGLLACFLLCAWSAGRLAGYVFLASVAFDPYLLRTLRRAMGESPMLLFAMLAMLAACAALRLRRRELEQDDGMRRSTLCFALAGLLAGAAGSSKLNGLGVVGAVALVGAIPLARAQWRRILVGWACLAAAAGGTFVALNPFLYRDTLGRAHLMIETKLYELDAQSQRFAGARIGGLAERAKKVPARVGRSMQLGHATGLWPLAIGLALVGLVALAVVTWRDGGEAAIALLAVALALGGPPLLSPLAWERYFLFPVLLGSLFASVAIAWVVAVLVDRVTPRGGSSGSAG